MKTVVALLVLMLNVLLSADHITAQETAAQEIVGRAVDEMGKPVADATILAVTVGKSNAWWSASADSMGQFHLQLPNGEFLLAATKEKAGYPDCRKNFFVCGSMRIRVSGTEPRTVTLRVLKPASLTGTISAADSAEPISKAVLRIRRGDDYFIMDERLVDSQFSVQVPSDVELSIEVIVGYYRWWEYRNPITEDASLKLNPGGQDHITVKLNRYEREPQPQQDR